MPNPFDALLNEDAPAAPAAPAAPVNPFVALLDERDRQRSVQLKSNVNSALSVNPDAAAGNKRTAQALGLPVAVVSATPEDSQREAAAKRVNDDLARYPTLQRHFANQDFANVAHDDTSTLDQIGKWIGGAAAYVMGARESGGLPGAIASAPFQASQGVAGAAKSLLDNAAPALDPLVGYGLSSNPLRVIGDWFGHEAAVADKTAKAFAPASGNFAEDAVTSGVQSTVTNLLNLPLTLANPALGLRVMSAQAAGQAYLKATGEGMDPVRALAFALPQGIIEYATERLPVMRLVEDMKVGSSILKLATRQLTPEVIGEQLATALQDFNEWAVLPSNANKKIGDYIADRPSAAAATLIATVVGVGATGASVHALRTVAGEAVQRTAEIGAAEADNAKLQQLLTLAAQSKLRERDPGSFAQLVQDTAEETGGMPTEVWFDARTLQQSLTPEQLVQLPSLADTLADAAETNAAVPVPLGDIAAYVAGTPLEQTLLQHARSSADGLSKLEAQDAGAMAEQYLQSQAAAAIETVADAEGHRASANTVRDTVVGQLAQANRFKSDVNEAYGTLVGDFYSVMSARLGVTPEQLYAQYPLTISATNVGEIEQPAYHGTPHEVDRFTTQKIGTGEGAQAYGWGMYFAGNRDVAEFYRKSVSEARGAGTGRTYQVDIPADDQVLDHDARLSEQPESVRAALEGLGIPATNFNVIDPSGKVVSTQATRDAARTYITRNNVAGTIKEAKSDMTGASAYALLSKRLGGDEAASRALNDAGVPGLRFLDADSRGAHATAKSHNYVVFGDNHVQITDTLHQSPTTARGTFSPSKMQITLLEHADLSTFLHETGHFFLEAMTDIAARPDAPAAVAADTAALMKWFGIRAGDNKTVLETWKGMSLDEQRPYHEQFAESFEQYLFEGKAPNTELQPLFDRFRSWMTSVYRSLQSFLAARDTKLSPSVRAVFDRMIASEESIADAEAVAAYAPLFKSAEQAGMSPAEWAAYQAIGKEATDNAITNLQARSLRDMRWTSAARAKALRQIQRDVDAKRKAVEEEVRAEIAEQPVMQAVAYLRESRAATPEEKAAAAAWREERATQIAPTRENVKAALLEGNDVAPSDRGQFLAKHKREIDLETERQLLQWERENPRPKRVHAPVDYEDAAARFGFTSGDELHAAIDAAPRPSELIEGLTDQRMLERYGDIASTDGQKKAADEAVHNEARARFIATGLSALGNATRQTTEKVPGRKIGINVIQRAARSVAKSLIARRKLRDLRPGTYANAEAKAGKIALEATAKGDTQRATAAVRDQLLNHYALGEARKAAEEVEKGIGWMRKLAASTTLPAEYREQVDAMLDRFDLRDRTLKAIDRSATLAEWIESQRAIGVEPDLPARLADEAFRKNYKDMTVEEFRGLVDALKQIEHLGRLKGKLLLAKDNRDFAEVRDTIAQSIIDNAGGRTNDARSPTTSTGRTLRGLKNFWSAHIKVSTLARIFDGGKDDGPFWSHIVRTATEKSDWEVGRRAKATGELAAIMAPWLKGGNTGGAGKFFPSVNRSFNRESILAIALNTGNAGNLQRMLGGERNGGWTFAQIQPMLDTLTREDWNTVQAIWDHFDSYRPEIGAKQKRVYGVEPKWVDPVARTVTLGDGTTMDLKGGYFPIKYDPAGSVRAEEHADAEGAKRQLQGAYGASTTRRSFTKARAEEVVGRPLMYTLEGVYTGVNDVIHDLAWHEWLIDTNRLLRSEAIDGAIRHTYGPEKVAQLKSWRDALAEGDAGSQEALDGALGQLRQGVSIAGLGLNVVSALQQPLGITQSIVRIGAKWVGRGIHEYIKNPVAAARDVNAKSAFMRERSRTQFRELNELRNRIQKPGSVRVQIAKVAYIPLLRLQQVVDVPTWIGAYEKAIAAGSDEATAVVQGDRAVREAQGGGQTVDLSAIERGGPAQKLFTVFYSFMNTALNLGVAAKMTPASKIKFASDMLLLYVIPAFLGGALKDALRLGDDDDDEAIWKKLIENQLSYLMGLMVVVREFGDAAATMVGVSSYDRGYSGPAGVRVVADAYKLAQQAKQGEIDAAALKAVNNFAGSALGLPSAQINRTVEGTAALIDGDTKNPAAVLLGYKQR